MGRLWDGYGMGMRQVWDELGMAKGQVRGGGKGWIREV